MTRTLCLCAIAWVALASNAAADRLYDAIAKVQADVATARQELKTLRSRIASERAAARDELAKAERAARRAAKQTSQVRNALQDKRDELDRLHERAHNLTRQTRDALASLREARKQAGALFESGCLPAPSLDVLDAKLASDSAVQTLPSLCARFFQACVSHAEDASRIERQPAQVVDLKGQSIRGRMLRIGHISACFVGESPGRVGLLHREPGAAVPLLVDRGLPRRQRAMIRAAVAGKSSVVPVDVSGGWALARLQERRTLWERLVAGGPVMLPIGLVALAGLLIALERLVFLMRVDVNVDRLLRDVVEALSNRHYDEAQKFCRNRHGPISRMVSAGIGHAHDAGDHLEDVLEEAVLAELPTLERGLGSLSVFAAVAPLLGLLGTVSGMIETFRTITIYGTGNARLLSGGISEALITTWAGLCVAVPLLLVHAWLSRRVRKIVANMERGSIALANTLRVLPPDRDGEQAE